MVIEQNKKRSQFRLSVRNIASLFFLLCIALPVGFSLFLWLPKNSTAQWLLAGLVYVAATIATMFWAYWVFFYFVPTRLQAYASSWKIGAVCFSFLAGLWLSINLFIPLPPAQINPFGSPFLLKLIYRTGAGVLFGLLILYLIVLCGTIFPVRQTYIHRYSLFVSSLKFAIPSGIIWLVYLMAFYPAMMSNDSMDQWGQVLSGRFVDHHPAFHTFLLWLLTRISLTPTIIAVAQIIALAMVAGFWFAFFESLGIRRWIIWTGAALFALTPVNGTMVVTLWKDIPYSTVVLGLTLIIAKVIVTKGAWINALSSQIILGITAALVLLLRYDGLVLGLGSLVVLFLAYPKNWKSWLVPFMVCGFLYLGIRGPVYKWVGVEKPATFTSDSLSLYSLAASTRPGSETEKLLSEIKLSSPAWGCSLSTAITPEMRKTDISADISLPQKLGNLIPRIPNLLSYYMRCARSLGWVIWDPNGEVRNPSHAQVWIDPNPYGIQPDSKIPALRLWLSNWVVKTSYNPNLNWFYWRPALYLYINLFLVAVLIIRNRNLRFGLLCVPILIQTISFTLILAAPNFRYHYAVYLVSLISLPLFFSPPVTEGSSEAKSFSINFHGVPDQAV